MYLMLWQVCFDECSHVPLYSSVKSKKTKPRRKTNPKILTACTFTCKHMWCQCIRLRYGMRNCGSFHAWVIIIICSCHVHQRCSDEHSLCWQVWQCSDRCVLTSVLCVDRSDDAGHYPGHHVCGSGVGQDHRPPQSQPPSHSECGLHPGLPPQLAQNSFPSLEWVWNASHFSSVFSSSFFFFFFFVLQHF